MVRVDGFGVFLGVVVVAATAMGLLLALAYLRREGLETPEYLALLLLSAGGMLVMTTANDLVVVFVSLEILSIPLYVLAAFDRRRLSSQEAGIKYFVLGAFSSAILLYGVALTYGATGTTSLTGIAKFLSENTLLDQGTLLAGFALLLVGLGFKIAAVPFHAWTPDVYQGAPTPVTAFMASATKAAGFAALLRSGCPDRHQADARVLVDRARGLCAHRVRGDVGRQEQRRRAGSRVCAALLARLRVHDRGGVRGARARWTAG